MNVSAVTAPVPVVSTATSETKPPEVKADGDGTRTPQPTVLAALPPGQGTRINQLA